MATIYRLIVTVLMTSSVAFGYRRMFGSRRHMKGRRLRPGEFGNLDAAYDFFSQAVAKKPFLSEIHLMPPVYVIKEPFQPSVSSKILLPPKLPGKRFAKQAKNNAKTNNVKNGSLSGMKRPLVQLLNRKDSEIGQAIDKFLKAIDAKKKKKVNPVPKTSQTVETATLIADNKAPPVKTSFPIPVSNTLDIHTLGPGPYKNCFPPATVVCGARLPWEHVQGMSSWCEQNCDKEAYTKHCDDFRCTCKCLKPGEPF